VDNGMGLTLERDSRTEARILEAARQEFIERGGDGARMQAIADRAGLNKALLHYYFRSKDRLYAEVLRAEFEDFASALFGSIPQTDDVAQLLRVFVDNYIDRLAERPYLVSFVLWELRRGGETVGEIVQRHLTGPGGGRPFPVAVIERAAAEGAIRPVDPVQFLMTLIGACLYPFIARPLLERVFPGLEVLSPEFLARRKEEVTRVLWAGIRAEASPRARRRKE
jgi:TetR/AcrR family transcriptional regulator